jgi:hypothetical protein
MANPAERSRYSPLLTAVVVALLIGGVGAPPAGAQSSTCPQATPAYTGPCGPTFVLPGWGDAGGWTNPEQYETIQLADVDGDDDEELLARTPAGVSIHDFDRTVGQWRPQVDANEVPLILTEFANPPPLTTANPRPPATDWTRPQYYDTIQAADVDGQKGEEILARAAAGLIVYKFTPGASPGHGSWRKLPVSDAFGDPYWGADPSNYTTIQTGDLNGDGDAEVFGRQGDGIVAVNWTGGAGLPWSLLPELNVLGDRDEGKNPAYYTSLQAANIDGDSREELVLRDRSGVGAYKLRSGRWTHVNKLGGTFADVPETADCPFVPSPSCFGTGPTYYGTIQLADVDGNGRDELLGRASDGLRVRRYGGDTPALWGLLPTLAALSDANGWTPQQYWETIQFADINADGRAEALARGPAGLNAWSYDPDSKTWNQLTPSTALALADDPWGSDRSYYSTIETGDVDGDKRADLIARGPYGIRTWFFNRRGTGGWERYRVEGYAQFATAGQQAAFTELNARAKTQGLIPGTVATVRDVWAGENAPAPTDLTTLQSQLATFGACVNQSSPVPPQYLTCTPPAGSSGFTAADWTSVLNEILAELYWAEQVVGHLNQVQSIRQSLFLEQNAQLPQIGKDLQLAAAASTPAQYDPKGLLVGMFGIASSLAAEALGPAGMPLAVVAELISTLPSATPSLTSAFDGTYSDLQNRFANSIADVDKALAEHSQIMRQDSGLLTLVGRLRALGTWELDAVGMASAGRQGFALSVYKTLLPTIWARYVISGCQSRGDVDCSPPPSGPWMAGNSDAFTAIGPPNPPNSIDPCSPGDDISVCEFVAPPADLANRLWGQVSPSCAYVPGNSATTWTFGCDLGVDPSVTAADTSTVSASQRWSFPPYTGVPVMPPSLAGSADAIGGNRAVLRLKGRVALPRAFALRRARVVADRLLFERGGARELVRHRSGRRLPPLILSPPRGSSKGVFASQRRGRPQVRLRLRRSGRRTLSFRLRAGNLMLPNAPAACSGTRPGVDLATEPITLHTRLRIEVRRRAIPIDLRPQWKCRRDSRGTVRRLVVQRPRIRKPRGRALSLAVSGPGRIRVGGRPLYRITVRNGRRTTAHDVIIRAILPRGLTLRRGAARHALWRLPALRPGRSRTFRLRPGRWRSGVRVGCLTVVAGAIDTAPAKRRICTRGP